MTVVRKARFDWYTPRTPLLEADCILLFVAGNPDRVAKAEDKVRMGEVGLRGGDQPIIGLARKPRPGRIAKNIPGVQQITGRADFGHHVEPGYSNEQSAARGRRDVVQI